MCYKPRMTPLLITAEEKGWCAIGGVEAMVEQGLAQARMWAATAQAFAEGKETFDPIPYAVKAGMRDRWVWRSRRRRGIWCAL